MTEGSIEPEIEALFEQTLVGDYDDKFPWDAVHELRTIGTEQVFSKAVSWCTASDPLQRARGLDILAQIGWNTSSIWRKSLEDRALAIVTELLRSENEINPITSAIYALGHIGNGAAIPLIVEYAKHSDSNVRYATASALGSFSDDPASIEALLILMCDEDADIRDWATFGLGAQSDADDDRIRRALAARLDDVEEGVRFEAIIGLGRRRDRRAIGYLKTILHDEPENFSAREAAAMLLGLDEYTSTDTHELLGALQRLQRWRGDR